MQFSYQIQGKLGLHIQPATLLVKEAQKYTSTITISGKDKTADLKRVFGVVGLGIKCGEVVTIHIEGDDAEKAYQNLQAFIAKIV